MTEKIIKSFTIGNESYNSVKVEIFNYLSPDLTDYWDANRLKSKIRIKAGAFKGEYFSEIQTVDFREFKNGLERLYKDLKGSLMFYSIESGLSMEITGDGIGHFNINCMACDFPVTGNRLEFTMQIDQTEIPDLIQQLDGMLEIFPVKGQGT